MAPFDRTIAPSRRARERHHRLRDVVARIGDDPFAKLGDLLLARRGSHEHAIAARFVGRLDHQFGQMPEDEFQIILLRSQIGRHIRQDRFLAEVILNDARHKIIDHLVIGHSGADGICQRDISRAIGIHQSRHPKHRIFSKHHRIDEVVINAPVNHIHPPQAARGAHVNKLVHHHEVTPFNDVDAHFPREITMLEISTIVAAGRKQHAHRVVVAAR